MDSTLGEPDSACCTRRRSATISFAVKTAVYQGLGQFGGTVSHTFYLGADEHPKRGSINTKNP